MLMNTSFHRKTRKGIVKVVRERYLRDDIGCNVNECTSCSSLQQMGCIFLNNEELNRILIMHSDVVHQLDVIEDTVFKNVVICQTVLEAVKHKNVAVYKRLVDLLQLSLRSCGISSEKMVVDGGDSTATGIENLMESEARYSCFLNEFHKDVYIEQEPNETAVEYAERAVNQVAVWYKKHLQFHSKANTNEVVLLTNSPETKNKAITSGLVAFTLEEYVRVFCGAKPELLDKIAQSQPTEGVTGAQVRKRRLFEDHLPLSELMSGIKSGRFKQGSFQVSRDNYLEAYVFVEGESEPVFVQGLSNCNRAVHDDVVAVEMLPRDEWSYPAALLKVLNLTENDKEMIDALNEIDSDDDTKLGEADETQLREALTMKRSSSRKRKAESRRDESVEKDTQNLLPTAKVVGIIKRSWRPFCGMLLRSPIADSRRHLFIPADRRIPKIRLETRQADILAGQRIIVSIDYWDVNSRYPCGHFVRSLGPVGDKATENEVLLIEHDIPHHEFTQAALDCLPKLPWIIGDEDWKERADFRDLDICSVDPPGCTDIDDALHCRKLKNNLFEVGVHIADVSHFVRPNNAMDDEASSRGTTVYLVDKRIDMLPNLLSSDLCSLKSDCERFAFSVIWEVTEDAEIKSVRYTKSVIRSRASLTYAEAQAIIEQRSRNDSIALSLRALNQLSKKLKAKRHAAGALSLASLEIRFNIDSETHDPIDVQSKKALETNSMVEEFMLLANCQVAVRILEEFPDSALLRRHPVPPQSNFRPIVDVAKSRGLSINASSGKLLSESLESAVVPDNPFFNTMLRILTCRCMTQALYFSSGTVERGEYLHFGLASPIYTHFTSPIRRYADLIVHRLLAECIGTSGSYPNLLDRQKVQKLCNNLNYRHKMAQYAGRASVLLNTHLFFKNRIEDLEGYVMATKKNALQVLIPKYGLESAVIFDSKCPLKYDPENNCLVAPQYNVTLRTFDRVTVQISVNSTDMQHQKLQLKLVQPMIPGFSAQPLLSAPENSTEGPIIKRDPDAFLFG